MMNEWVTPLAWTSAAGATALVGTVAYGLVHPRSGLWGRVVCRGDALVGSANRVALTFDDGPSPKATGAILDELGRLEVKGAFFVIGKNAVQWPELIRRMDREGHIVGNHTYDHDYLGTMRGRRYWMNQLQKSDEAIERMIGRRPALFRPPMGMKAPPVIWAARQRGQSIVTWTRRGMDGVATRSELIIQRLREARAGEILALHDGFDGRSRRNPSATIAALGPVIGSLRKRGMEVARLDELIGIRPYL